MIAEHVAAIRSALEGSGLPVYLAGDVPVAVSTPYLVLTPDMGHPDRDTLVGARTRLDMTFQVTSVGASSPEVLAAADRSRLAVLDAVLSIPGRRCWPIVHGDSQPIHEDHVHIPDGTARPLLIAVDTYGLASVPAIAS